MPSRQSQDFNAAIVDTVQVRGQRMGRSNTQAPLPKSSPALAPRSHSQDSGTPPRVPPKSRSKKGSQHADVIDRLDFTGVGPMFHHDGPFDACAPSRNRHRNKAPMMAWTGGDQGPYPSADAAAFSDQHYEPPKKKVDAIAEAWGIHEPEPYEEFFAGGGTRGDTPASSIFNGKESHSSSKSRRRDRDNDEHRSRPTRRGIPPPQPIFVPDPTTADIDAAPSSSSPTGNGPKRSKSLMHRIRKMRDSPNVPVGPDYDESPMTANPASPSYDRPTHKSNNSFLGRFGSPKPEAASEPFIFIDNSNGKDKDLPAPPMDSSTPKENSSSNSGYFDINGGSGASPGLGRKTSLIKKVGRVVRGQR